MSLLVAFVPAPPTAKGFAGSRVSGSGRAARAQIAKGSMRSHIGPSAKASTERILALDPPFTADIAPMRTFASISAHDTRADIVAMRTTALVDAHDTRADVARGDTTARILLPVTGPSEPDN